MVQRICEKIPDKKDDGLLNLIGRFGKWQLILFITVSVVKVSSGWVQLSISFLTPSVVFWCINFGNSSKIAMNSTCYDDCVEYDYDSRPMMSTIVSEWDLICDRRWLASFTQTMLQFGILSGSIAFGFLSDRFGRRIMFLISTTALIIIGLAIPFSPDYITFTILRFIWGFATAGTMVISFVIIMENLGPEYREIFGCLFQIPFMIGHALLPIFAYYYRTWKMYSLSLAIPTVVYLGYFFVLNESPRWLISVGKVEEAADVVTKAAKMNGRPTANIRESVNKICQDLHSKPDESKPNYSDLFRSSLRLKTTCSCIMWLIAGLSFFGLNQYISNTSPDPFLSVAVSGLVQIPSNFLAICLLRYYGRRTVLALAFSLGGLCVLTLACVPNTYWITLTLGSLGVSGASIACTAIYIHSSELFPTVVRNMGMGACSMSMRLGSMIAPFVSSLSVTQKWMPNLIFGLSPIAAGLICLLLPETKGVVLPDTMEDVKISSDKVNT